MSRRLVLLTSALVSIVVSVLLFFFLSYADSRKYEPEYEWVSSSTMQPLALVGVGAFVLGLVLAISGLLQKPAE